MTAIICTYTKRRKWTTDLQRENIIAQALDTDEGRRALSQAMVEPIAQALNYQDIGRRLLMVDELPQGALARYERDVESAAYTLDRRGAVPDRITEGEEVLVPTFEIATNPQIRLSEIRDRRFHIVDRAQENAAQAMAQEIDREIFRHIEVPIKVYVSEN